MTRRPGWLKEILEENRRVVASWPAWKRIRQCTREEGRVEQVTVYQTPLLTLDTNAAASGGLIEVIKLADHRREVEGLTENREFWRLACLEAQKHRDLANGQVAILGNELRDRVQQVAQLTAERDDLRKGIETAVTHKVLRERELTTLRGLVEVAVMRWRAQANAQEGISFKMAMKGLEATLAQPKGAQ